MDLVQDPFIRTAAENYIHYALAWSLPAWSERPIALRFGPDGCAYVVDYGVVRDAGADSHVVGTGNGSLVQIPGTGVVWKICPSP